MATVDDIKSRLTSRFMAGHAIFSHLDAGEFDKAADIVKAKYAYTHPLEEQIRSLTAPPAAESSRRGRRAAAEVAAPEQPTPPSDEPGAAAEAESAAEEPTDTE